MPKNGRPRHVLTMMMEIIAMVGVPSQDGPVGGQPAHHQQAVEEAHAGVEDPLPRHRAEHGGHDEREQEHGARDAFIRKFWFITSAMPSPPEAFSTVATAVKMIVFLTDCQKIGSLLSLTKLPKPTKEAARATSLWKKLRYTP